jgi:hypothetical protein
MDTDVLAFEQFATLQDIGQGGIPVFSSYSFAHLALLLKLNYIRADRDGYSSTPSGLVRIASGF